mmetsp:Transcript_48766/g.105827  ORF Transcript_48766/g.105827 Transcript_48766/m.105827 type:complete len:509 (-) Transcript_48766:161-1687(-)
MLAYWMDDERTGIVLLYLDQVGNPINFGRLAPEISRRKPVVVVRAGDGDIGVLQDDMDVVTSPTPLSPTALARTRSQFATSLQLPDQRGMMLHAGLIPATNLSDAFTIVRLLAAQSPPLSNAVGLVGNSTSLLKMTADAAIAHGLIMPPLHPSTIDTVRRRQPRCRGTNPINLPHAATPDDVAASLECVARQEGVDSLIVCIAPIFGYSPRAFVDAVAAVASRLPPTKPLAVVCPAPDLGVRGVPRGDGLAPIFDFPETAALSLGAAARYSEWRSRPHASPPSLSAIDVGTIRAVVERVLQMPEADDDGVWLEPRDGAAVMRAAGIELAESVEVDAADAPDAAVAFGFPVVVKGVSVRGARAGGVAVGLRSKEDVVAAVSRIRIQTSSEGTPFSERVLLQAHVEGGVDAVVAVAPDKTFGPTVMCGLGGPVGELLHEFSYRLTPLSEHDATDMVDSLRTRCLLDGYGGAPPVDKKALIAVVMRVSALVEVRVFYTMHITPLFTPAGHS